MIPLQRQSTKAQKVNIKSRYEVGQEFERDLLWRVTAISDIENITSPLFRGSVSDHLIQASNVKKDGTLGQYRLTFFELNPVSSAKVNRSKVY